MIAHINLESMPDGTVAFRAVYPDGFQVDDPAHQLAYMLVKYADSICQRMAEPVVEMAPGSMLPHSGLILSA